MEDVKYIEYRVVAAAMTIEDDDEGGWITLTLTQAPEQKRLVRPESLYRLRIDEVGWFYGFTAKDCVRGEVWEVKMYSASRRGQAMSSPKPPPPSRTRRPEQ